MDIIDLVDELHSVYIFGDLFEFFGEFDPGFFVNTHFLCEHVDVVFKD